LVGLTQLILLPTIERGGVRIFMLEADERGIGGLREGIQCRDKSVLKPIKT